MQPSGNFLEKELAELLYVISRLENDIEEHRINLAENDKFNAEDAFEILDRHKHGYLLISDFTSFFSRNHLPVLEREVFYLFNHYSRESDRQMGFREFLRMITPVTNTEVRERFLRRGATRVKRMPFFLVDQLAQLFQKELEFFLKTETLKMNLMHTYGWNTLKAFSVIDRARKNYIDYQDVTILVEKIGQHFSKEDYKALSRRLDRDFNEKITKNEFCDALLPNDVSREDLEIRLADFSEKPADFFFDPARTARKTQENLKKTEKRQYLSQNINLINQDYDNVFAGDEELKHIKPFMRNQEDFIVFRNENFVRQSQNLPQTPQKPGEFHEKPRVSATKFEENPRNFQENPRNFQENPRNFQENPMNFQENPRNFQENPRNFQENSRNFQENPRNLEENAKKFRETAEKLREISQSSALRNSKRIFEREDFHDSPERKDVDLLKQSLENLDFRREKPVAAIKESNFASNQGNFAHLFQRKT